MNKRENAIWKLVAFLGLFLLVLNIFSTIKSNSKLASSIYGRKCDSGQEDCNEKRGIIDYFYEFEQYPNSITQDNSDMLKIINSYDSVNGDEILSKSKKTGLNEEVEISKLNFMEIYSPSSIYGFSLNDEKISGSEELFLTEIKVNTEKNFNEVCSNKKKLRLNNAIFLNDEIQLGQNFLFKESNQNCKTKESSNSEDFLFMSEDGEVWYNSSRDIHSFEFRLDSGKILNIIEGLDPNIFDNFIILNTDNSVIGIS